MNDLFFTLLSVNIGNLVDDTTRFVCDLILKVVLTQLEECSELVIAWCQLYDYMNCMNYYITII